MKIKTQEGKKLISIMFKIISKLSGPNIVCDQSGKILFANETYKKLVTENPNNQLFWKVFPLTITIPIYFTEAIEQKTETRSEIICKEKTFITRVIPIHDILVDKVIYIVRFEDITSNINLNNQLKQDKVILLKSFLNSILAFSDFLESRDVYTSGHQKRVAALSMNIATQARITDHTLINAIYYGALMHDIGKVAIPMEYLVTPRRLTEHEFEIIKTHVAIGNRIIEHVEFPWDLKSVVYQHHERLDGSGYPNGLKDEQITIPARIVAIADVYEAMSSNRPYRNTISQETTLNYLKENKGTLFDAHYVDCLLECVSNLKDVYEINPNFRPFEFL